LQLHKIVQLITFSSLIKKRARYPQRNARRTPDEMKEH